MMRVFGVLISKESAINQEYSNHEYCLSIIADMLWRQDFETFIETVIQERKIFREWLGKKGKYVNRKNKIDTFKSYRGHKIGGK